VGDVVKWAFGSFVERDGASTVHQWYDSQIPDVRAAFDMSLRYLRDQPPANWVRPYVGTLKRECLGLVEIRFTANKVRHRPVGFFGPERMMFTILSFAIEKDRKFVPPTVCETALRKKSEVILEPGRSRKYDPGD
jgi:hypothetical protein